MVLSCLKEPHCFLVREASNLAIVGDPQLHEPRNISAQQFLVDGVLQCGAQNSQYVANRAGGQDGLAAARIGSGAASWLPGRVLSLCAALALRAARV
jgi:hypothetical protein